MRQRQATVGSQISGMTFQTPVGKEKANDGLPANTPSAHSEFSFAAELRRSEMAMGELKGSQGSNQSRHSAFQTKRMASGFLSPTASQPRNLDSRTGSRLDPLSDDSSDER